MLDYQIDTNSIYTSDSREYPIPNIVSHHRWFLGMKIYYRRFTSNFTAKVQPFNDLLHKKKSIVLSLDTIKASNAVNEAICSVAALSHGYADPTNR